MKGDELRCDEDIKAIIYEHTYVLPSELLKYEFKFDETDLYIFMELK